MDQISRVRNVFPKVVASHRKYTLNNYIGVKGNE